MVSPIVEPSEPCFPWRRERALPFLAKPIKADLWRHDSLSWILTFRARKLLAS